MERRGKKCGGRLPLAVERCIAALTGGAEQDDPGATGVTPPTIEISDDDYRTLHLPCDTLEESGDSESGLQASVEPGTNPHAPHRAGPGPAGCRQD